MPIAPYPRFGQLLAPKTLRSILDVPLPRYVVKRFAQLELQEARLADLDAMSWERFGQQVCEQLARAIIEQVSRAIISPSMAIRRQRLPRLKRPLSIDDLPVETRTYNCLRRAYLGEDMRQLGDLTIGDLLALRSFGSRCLVDLLSALEAMRHVPASPFSPMGGSATPALPSSASLSWLEWARADYSYLPGNARQWTFPDLPSTLTLEQLDIDNRTRRRLHHSGLGNELSTLSGSPIIQLLKIPGFGLGCMRSLLCGLNAALHPLPQPPAPDLETEMLNVFLPDYNKNRRAKTDRNHRIFMRVYGLDGQGGALLSTIGRSERICVERVRQVCQLRPRLGHSTPRLEQVLQAVAELVPAPAADIEAELVRRGLVSRRLPLASLDRFARALGRPLSFKLAVFGYLRHWALRPYEHEELFPYLVRAARRCIKRCGAASIDDVAAHAAASAKIPVSVTMARHIVCRLPDFCWLDEATGWFWLRSFSYNPLLFYARKALAAVARLSVDELRDAIRRLPKGRFDALPPHILKNMCCNLPGVRLEGDDLVADPPLDWRVVLQGNERKVVGIFHKYGPLLPVKAMKRYARRCGIGAFALWMALRRIPSIRRYDSGVYGLCGIRNYPTKPNDSEA